MADFSLLGQPNFAAAAMSGYQAGQALGRQKQLDGAMANIDLERPETILPILRADPATGAALLGTSLRYAEQKHELNKAAAFGDAVGKYFGAGGSKPSGTVTASPAVAPSAPVSASSPAPITTGGAPAPADPNEVVITAPHPSAQGNLPQAISALVSSGASIEDAQHFVGLVGSMDEQQKKYLDDKQDALAHAALTLKSLPMEQRAAKLQQLAPDLLQHHVTPQQIQSAPLDDTSLDHFVNQAMAVKDVLSGNREDAKFSDQIRHEKVDEGQGAAHIAIDQQNVGIAAGHLALDRAKETREANKPVPGAGVMSPLPSPMTKAAYDQLPSGTRYRAPDGTVKIKH